MGRKRRKRSGNRKSKDLFCDNDTPVAVQNENNEEEENLMRQMGLPVHFGMNPIVQEEYEDDSYPPFDEPNYDEQECIEEEETLRKKRKRNKEQQSEHTVYSDEFTIIDLLAFHPKILNYALQTETDTNANNEMGIHIYFDEDGQPIPIIESDVEVQTLLEVNVETKAQDMETSTETSNGMSSEMDGRTMKKYHRQRFDFFTLFDKGIQIDNEGWFSVTPELIATHTATTTLNTTNHSIIWDAFTGVGGNAIQFAMAGHHVIATELNPKRTAMAKHNASIYGVDRYIDFICADALQLPHFWRQSTDKRTFGAVFLSPPWGGPSYTKLPTFEPLTHLPLDCREMVNISHSLCDTVIYYMPRSTNIASLAKILPSNSKVKVERHLLADRLKVVIIKVFSL